MIGPGFLSRLVHPSLSAFPFTHIQLGKSSETLQIVSDIIFSCLS